MKIGLDRSNISSKTNFNPFKKKKRELLQLWTSTATFGSRNDFSFKFQLPKRLAEYLIGLFMVFKRVYTSSAMTDICWYCEWDLSCYSVHVHAFYLLVHLKCCRSSTDNVEACSPQCRICNVHIIFCTSTSLLVSGKLISLRSSNIC